MANDQTTIHGSLFFLLKGFIEDGKKVTWDELLSIAKPASRSFSPHENYPLSDMESIIAAASVMFTVSAEELKEKFGQKIAPVLLEKYKSYINPEWKTFEVLEYTELVMHKAVRKEESSANPPMLYVSRVHDKLLVIDYYSKRRMGSLAVGIIRGIAQHYSEGDRVKVIPLTDPGEERVQIRIEFS